MPYPLSIPIVLALCLVGAVAGASVSPEEAARLGGADLTPVGAERAGNAEGSIPPWTGGLAASTPSHQSGDFHSDPFADDPVLFTVTAANMAQYADKLSEGQKALLQAQPDSWRMNVYRSRRSAHYPQFVYDAIKLNAEHARVDISGLGGVNDSSVASPFPIPKQGVEVMWNHNLRWRGVHVKRVNGQAAVTRRGNYRVVLLLEELGFLYDAPEAVELKEKYPFFLLAWKQKTISPGFLAGRGRLLLEPVNYNERPRMSWIYNPGLRRVFRLPSSGFDNPAPESDGLRTADESDMFNGSPGLFDWKLLGKREMLIPYNAYQLHGGDLSYDDIVKHHHINPDLARYELHRVWVVEGTVKSPTRRPSTNNPEKRGHIYSRRVFYLDEDSWQIALADNYDGDGQLWRFSEGHMINYYQVGVPWYTLETYYDLKERRYLVNGLDNRRTPYQFNDKVNPRHFSPSALQFYVR